MFHDARTLEHLKKLVKHSCIESTELHFPARKKVAVSVPTKAYVSHNRLIKTQLFGSHFHLAYVAVRLRIACFKGTEKVDDTSLAPRL
jgi:hypothetical protein